MPGSDPVRNYSLNFKDKKEESLAKNRPILASRRLVQSMFQIILANKETCANTLSIPPTKRLFTQRTIPTNARKWKVVHAHSLDVGDMAIAVSKIVTRMVRHYDQDERQSAGPMHLGQLGQYC